MYYYYSHDERLAGVKEELASVKKDMRVKVQKLSALEKVR